MERHDIQKNVFVEDGHLFKWVEDGTYEEVNELKIEGTFLINYLKLQIENLKEEIQRCKNKMKIFKRKTIVLFGGLCVVAIVVFCEKMFDQGESSLVFGKKKILYALLRSAQMRSSICNGSSIINGLKSSLITIPLRSSLSCAVRRLCHH
ncbi:hypothetical protein YC2023_017033 [Brassica napus]